MVLMWFWRSWRSYLIFIEDWIIIMRDKIKLESSAGTGHFYTTTKNKRTMPGKMEIKKFDPVARKHVIYKETKLK